MRRRDSTLTTWECVGSMGVAHISQRSSSGRWGGGGPCAKRLSTPSVTEGSELLRGEAHRRVYRLDDAAVAEIHVHAAGQARIEAPHRAHDVDALELLGRVLLED